MEQRYLDAIAFVVIVLAVFSLANLYELVKNYVKFNK